MNSGRRTAKQEEEYYIHRRNAELRKQEHWNSVADYFKTWDVKASKYAAWTSPRYFQQSEDARIEADKKKERQHSLNERRDKLKVVLQTEDKMYGEELKRLISNNGGAWMPLDELKSINVELKRRSEESRKREAELVQYQRWKQQQPTLKDLERRQHLDYMKKSWIDQVKEREAAREKQRAQEFLRVKEDERKRQEEEALGKICQKRKENEIKELKKQIKIQMDAIKESVQKYKRLEIQEAEERRLQNEIEEMITQRQLAEKKQSDKQLVAYWTRQYQLKLQKKAKEMEEDITQDQLMLERLNEEVRREAQTKVQSKETAKKEMEMALRDLQMQKQRELLRQKEYEHMFFEEAKRAWETQEEKWAKEQRARDILMKEVLDTVKKQVEEKLRRSSAERAEALEERERLLKGINDLYQQCKQEELDVKLAKDKYCKDLGQQVKAKQLEKANLAIEESQIEKRYMASEEETERKLALEVEKIQLQSSNYIPQNFRRQRVHW